MKYCKDDQNATQRHKVGKCCCCWKKGADRLLRCRACAELHFVRNVVSAKGNKAKCNKTRCACTTLLISVDNQETENQKGENLSRSFIIGISRLDTDWLPSMGDE